MAIAVVLICVAVSVAMIPLIRLLSSEAGQQLIVQKMESFGIFAPLLFVLLQVIQVVIAVIPGGPVPIIGGVLFGEWGALALCLAGSFWELYWCTIWCSGSENRWWIVSYQKSIFRSSIF
ncbi:MAG: hypothetical protein ACLT2C_03495 [Ruminococcus sp.]